jgi:enoyl-CoA hydratase
MYFTGEMVGAEELYRLGAVEAVVPPEQLLPEALKFATLIASKSPIALRMAKESLNRFEEFLLPYEDAYRMEQDYTNRLGTFEDAKEGTAAFLEKREPQWKWR